MSFESELAAFAAKAKQRERELFVNVVSAVKDSIVNGSPITGAKGQPVVTGNLRDSFQVEFESPEVALISTNVAYARTIEENTRGATIPKGGPKGSKVGGPHSIKQTVAGFARLLDAEVAKVTK